MRRFFLGMAIASLTASAPVAAFGGDREIADTIISVLKQHQTDGSLKGFDIDLSVEAGLVTLTGSVADSKQAQAVIDAARSAPGVQKIVNNVEVRVAKRDSKPTSNLEFAAQANDQDQSIQAASATESEGAVPVPSDDSVAPAGAQSTAEPPKLTSNESTVSPQDAAITDTALNLLGQEKATGRLRNFELDLSTVEGEVWVRGFVSTPEQKKLVLQTVQRVRGVARVIDDVAVSGTKGRTSVQTASTSLPVESEQVGSMPVYGPVNGGPRPFAPSTIANYQGSPTPIPGIPIEGPSAGGSAGPVPMNMGPSYGAGVPRYDQPQMPGYAWPSYAAYPNYSAVTYPKQYSASAWPYIGPFYPYPQVPLGWRKVALEWDDGLWYLDFTSK